MHNVKCDHVEVKSKSQSCREVFPCFHGFFKNPKHACFGIFSLPRVDRVGNIGGIVDRKDSISLVVLLQRGTRNSWNHVCEYLAAIQRSRATVFGKQYQQLHPCPT